MTIRVVGLGDTYGDLEARFQTISTQWNDVEIYLANTFSPNQIEAFDGLIDMARTRIGNISEALGRRDADAAAALMDGFEPLAIKSQISVGISSHTNTSIGLLLGVVSIGAVLWMFHKTVN